MGASPIDEAQLVGLAHLQLKDRVYDHLRAGIIDGQYPIGASLREVVVATALGVSKTPVREAFVRLEKDRLVKLIPYKGAVVSGYVADDLREISEVRQLVQGACARSAAQEASAAEIETMVANLDAAETALRSGETDLVVSTFEQFDQLIYGHSRNQWLDRLIETLVGHQKRILRLTVHIPGRSEQSLREHQAIVEAIRGRDGELAETRMREHVEGVMADHLCAFGAVT